MTMDRQHQISKIHTAGRESSKVARCCAGHYLVGLSFEATVPTANKEEWRD
jgi:hypothetical protein